MLERVGTEPGPLSALVVDDDPALGDLLVTVLVEAGIAAVLVGTADDAERALASRPFDLVLLDRDLPGGRDGLSLLEKLRQDGSEVTVVIMTGVGTVANATRAMELGVSAFLAKPFADIFELVELVRRLAARSAERRRRRERRANHASLEEVTAALRDMTERLEARSHAQAVLRAALLVEDAGDKELARHELEAQGALVRDAGGAGALSDEYDLVVVGASLPQLLPLVESARAFTHAPILVMSTSPSMELIAKLIGLGVVAYAERPAHDVAGLRKKIAVALRRAREA